jgi:hypothetical protein
VVVEGLVVVMVHLGEDLVMRSTNRSVEEAWARWDNLMTVGSLDALKDYSVATSTWATGADSTPRG